MDLKAIIKNFVNLFYPLHCAYCKKPLHPLNELGICDPCKNGISKNLKPYSQSSYFDRAYSACLYEGALRELVHLFKYENRPGIAKTLAYFMVSFINENPDITADIDAITFVPLENSRLRERGFNHSEALAYNIAKAFNIPLLDTLEKVKTTRLQNELSRDERLVNLKDAFRTKKDLQPLEDLKILLIDDVMTTGATLSECSKVLRQAGAKEVRCFTLARGL